MEEMPTCQCLIAENFCIPRKRIRSNLRIAQNGRFIINPVYSGGGIMVAKMLDFRLSERLKMHPP